MNTFGRFFRLSIFGESHSQYIGVNLDGVMPGIKLSVDDFKDDLLKRSPRLKTETARKSTDELEIISGLYNGRTTGAPLSILVKNSDIDSSYYKEFEREPRPGHADITAKIKYNNYNDPRGGGQFSGRITVVLVIAGVLAKKILDRVLPKLDIQSNLISLKGSKNIEEVLEKALKEQATVGGLIETRVKNIPAGLGEPFFDSFESMLSHVIFAVPGIKGIDFDNAYERLSKYGSEYNKSTSVDGGITNGNDILFRIFAKPPASDPKKGRFDISFATRTPVIIEAVTNIVILDLFLLNKTYSG